MSRITQNIIYHESLTYLRIELNNCVTCLKFLYTMYCLLFIKVNINKLQFKSQTLILHTYKV